MHGQLFPTACRALGQPLLGNRWASGHAVFSGVLFSYARSSPKKYLSFLLMGTAKGPFITANMNFMAFAAFFPPLFPQIHLQKSSVIFHCLVTSPHSYILQSCLVYFLITCKPATIFHIALRNSLVFFS